MFLRIRTEIWDEDFSNGEVLDQGMTNDAYSFMTTLFLVEPNFCKL